MANKSFREREIHELLATNPRKAQHRYEFPSLSLHITEITSQVLINSFYVFTGTQVITRCGLGLERAAGEYTIPDV